MSAFTLHIFNHHRCIRV